MIHTMFALAAAAVFALCAASFAEIPASEQSSGQMPVPNQEMAPSPAQPPAQAPGMGEEQRADKPAKGSQTKGKAKAKGHAKKINKKHGDR